MHNDYLKLMLVTRKGDTPLNDYLAFIEECSKAGITAVQLREKNTSFQALVTFGKQLLHILSPLDIPLIINDHVELALALDAQGVHLGQSDGCPIKARQRLGSDRIIGRTVDSLEQLSVANEQPLDYVGVGTIFPTRNKSHVITHWGIDGLSQLIPMSKHRVVAIGGIDEHNVRFVMETRANGIAVIGAAHDSPSPSTSLQTIRQIIDQQGESRDSCDSNR